MSNLIPYFGGKNRLTKPIVARIPKHICYVEAFAGGAGVLFAKEPSKAEVINDLDLDLVTLYRVVKYHPEEFVRQFKYSLVARDEFKRLVDINPDTLTDVQRASRFFYLQKNAFGGKPVGRTFGTSTTTPPRLNLFNLEESISTAWQRLSGVVIERLDFRGIIPRYDRPHTFFFLDPPYWKIPGYRHDFVEQDFLDLSCILRTLKGKFLMTINDTPDVRRIFDGFIVEEVGIKYSVSASAKGRSKVRTELFVMNYE